MVFGPNRDCSDILEAFAPMSDKDTTWDLHQVDDDVRADFDRAYLKPIVNDPEEARQFVALRSVTGASERHDRAVSVKELKSQAKRQRRVAASLDAYASRLAALLEPYPDPRTFARFGRRISDW